MSGQIYFYTAGFELFGRGHGHLATLCERHCSMPAGPVRQGEPAPIGRLSLCFAYRRRKKWCQYAIQLRGMTSRRHGSRNTHHTHRHVPARPAGLQDSVPSVARWQKFRPKSSKGAAEIKICGRILAIWEKARQISKNINFTMPCILKIKFNFVLVYIIRGYHS